VSGVVASFTSTIASPVAWKVAFGRRYHPLFASVENPGPGTVVTVEVEQHSARLLGSDGKAMPNLQFPIDEAGGQALAERLRGERDVEESESLVSAAEESLWGTSSATLVTNRQ
jgi:hypothetical protein